MREAQQQQVKRPPALESALGHCLMDSDAESLRLARSNLRRSMLLSTGIQVALLSAALVAPLLATSDLVVARLSGEGPQVTPVPPVPPSAGRPQAQSRRPSTGPPTSSSVPLPMRPIAPRNIPDRIARLDDRDSAPPPVGGGGAFGPGVPGGVGPLGLGGGPALPPPPPPAESKPRGPRRVSVVHPARLIHKVEPVYPPLMRQIHKSGRVEFWAVIATDGTIRELTVMSGDPGFILAAQEAVLQWRYAPTVLNGEAVEVETRITVIFTMDRK